MARTYPKFSSIRCACVFFATAFLVALNAAKADQIVVPNYATNSQSPNSAEGEFNEIIRYQAVYGAAEFPSYPILISEIRWRPDSLQQGAVSNATISNIQINLSTTSKSADQLSLIFTENIGTDDTQVFAGTLNLNTSFTSLSNGSTAFDINLPLQTPFKYDPSKGNLLLDIRNFSGGAPSIFDNDIANSLDTVSRVFTTDGDVNSTTAGAADSGAGVIQITYAPANGFPTSPPAIALQPTDQQVVVNSNAIFRVVAISSTPLYYQWFFNDTNHPIVGETNNSLNLFDLQFGQGGNYFVQVSNTYGITISSNAVLSLLPLVITSQPFDQAVAPGQVANFEVAAFSGVPLAYQWYYGGSNLIAGATNFAFTVTNVQFNLLGFYSVQVSNVYGSVSSTTARLDFGVVVPNHSATNQNVGGDSSFSEAFREDDVYAASELPPYPIRIKEIRFRPDVQANGPISTTLPSVQFSLSTTKSQPDGLDSNFDQNFGLDNISVFNGSLVLKSGFVTLTNGTKAFDLRVLLQTNFVYDPLQGNLLLDFRNFSGSIPNEPNFINGTGGLGRASRMFASDANATSGSRDGGAYVLQIVYDALPASPIISSQPTNRTVTGGGTTTFVPTVGSAAPVSYQWFFMDTNNPVLGGTNASLILTNVQQSQAGIYFVLATNMYGSTFSSNAILTVTLDPPQITSQPISRSGIVGTNFTFAVSASGSLPLAYQWYYNTNSLISGATNSSLVLTNIQFNQSGTYSVVVSNAYGVTNSGYAVLAMAFPPVKILMGSTNVMGGASFALPVYLVANGNENALSFSVGFNTQRLAYASVDLGSDAADGSLFLNSSQAASGKIGITMQLPLGETFAPGTQEVVRVTFNSAFVTNTPVSTPVNFTNQPVARAVFDFNGIKLATNFVNSSVTLGVTDFEGDVNPRTTGDRSLDIFDWTQVGRFVAGLDVVSNATEFQKADSAPASSSGDGMLKVNDWVQAGRYGAALDAPRSLSGPTAPVTPVTLTGGPRTVNIAGGIGVEGLNIVVPVMLQSQGNENAVGFSVNFDPTLLKYVSTTKGSADASATLVVNSNQATSGVVGVVLALQSGNSFTNGTQAEIAKLTFTGLNTTSNGIVKFTNGPVLLAISDPVATELAANYTNSLVTINPPPTLSPTVTDTNVTFTWPTWGTGFNLQATGDLTQPWTNVVYTAQTNGSNIILSLPIPTQGGYFRLQHP